MTAASLLDELHRRGASVAVVGERLRIEAPAGVLTADVRAALASCKKELVRLLGEKRTATPEPSPVTHAAHNAATLADRIEAVWKPGEWLAYRDGGGLVTAKYAGINTEDKVNVWCSDGAVRAISAEAVALDWCPDASEIFEERLSIMLAAGISEPVARERAEHCTREYMARLRVLQ